MQAYAEFNRSQFPLITVTFTGAEAIPENFEIYLDGLYENYQREEPFVLVFDAGRAPAPNLTYQRKQADWMKVHHLLIKTYCRGIAYVVPGILLRNVLKLIFAIQRNPVPFKVFGNLSEGRAWAEGQL